MTGAELARRLAPRVRGRVIENAPLAPLTTFRVGGPADVLVEAESVDDLMAVGELLRDGVSVAIVGRGSNLLVADAGYRGVALKLGRAFRTHEETERGLRLGGAVYLPAAARLTARIARTGFEFAAEIPATFGGAVRMNAGAHDRCMADVLVSADVVDMAAGARRTMSVEDLEYGYRRSSLGAADIVVEGEVLLERADARVVAGRIASYLEWRREHQPPGRSAGSVFVNPPGVAAGRLIDEGGVKGMRVGGAEISPLHANFIVAAPDARAADVWEVINRARAVVRQRTGISLDCEVRFLGDFE